MRTSLLLLAALLVPAAAAQTGTFTFDAAAGQRGPAITSTVDGVTLTVTAGTSSGSTDLFTPNDGRAGSSGTAVGTNNATQMTLTFSQPVNVASFRLGSAPNYNAAGPYVITPDVGSAATATDDGSGVTVMPAGGFIGVSQLVVTLGSGFNRSFTSFVLDNVVLDASLPVELTGFTATASASDALLAWTTASETGNAGFEVQLDAGAGFARAGWVAGAGTTLEAQRYTFPVRGLAAGSYRFRLKQIDLDGAFALSPVVELAIAPAGYALEAPSAFSDRAAVRLTTAQAQAVRVVVYDLMGREVALLHDGPASGTVALGLDGTRLAAGLYFVRAQGETFSATRQIVRVR